MGDAAAPWAEALQRAVGYASDATAVNLGRPPTSPCWSLVLPTVAVASTLLLKDPQPRRAATKVPKMTFYNSIRLRSGVAFLLELACCVMMYVLSYIRRPKRATTSDVVAIYCGFGFIPGEKRHHPGRGRLGAVRDPLGAVPGAARETGHGVFREAAAGAEDRGRDLRARKEF